MNLFLVTLHIALDECEALTSFNDKRIRKTTATVENRCPETLTVKHIIYIDSSVIPFTQNPKLTEKIQNPIFMLQCQLWQSLS